MPYRVKGDVALGVVKDIIKSEILRLGNFGHPWQPQALHELLLDKGISIPVPRITQALDALVTDGTCETVP